MILVAPPCRAESGFSLAADGLEGRRGFAAAALSGVWCGADRPKKRCHSEKPFPSEPAQVPNSGTCFFNSPFRNV